MLGKLALLLGLLIWSTHGPWGCGVDLGPVFCYQLTDSLSRTVHGPIQWLISLGGRPLPLSTVDPHQGPSGEILSFGVGYSSDTAQCLQGPGAAVV